MCGKSGVKKQKCAEGRVLNKVFFGIWAVWVFCALKTVGHQERAALFEEGKNSGVFGQKFCGHFARQSGEGGNHLDLAVNKRGGQAWLNHVFIIENRQTDFKNMSRGPARNVAWGGLQLELMTAVGFEGEKHGQEVFVLDLAENTPCVLPQFDGRIIV
jgi:hypothetical protein